VSVTVDQTFGQPSRITWHKQRVDLSLHIRVPLYCLTEFIICLWSRISATLYKAMNLICNTFVGVG